MTTGEMKIDPGPTVLPPLGASSDLFEYSPIGIAFVAPDGRWLKVNDALCKLVGYSEAELLALTFLDITHPDDLQIGRDNLARQLAGEIKTFQVEKRYLHKDGRVITVLMSATLVRDGQRQPCHFICQVQDITARKRAEEEMRWKTALLEAQVDSSLDGILVVDPQGKKIVQNRRMNELLKIPDSIANDPDDEKQVRWVKAMTRDPQKFIEKVIHLYAHPEEKSRDEIELNDRTFLDRYSAPVLGADGTHYGRIWTFRDITKRRQTEESLRESEARYQRMAANVPGMVYQCVLRADGGMALPFVSEGCREIYGLEPAQLQSDPALLVNMVHPEDRADHAQSLAASAVSLDPWNWQGRIKRHDTGEVRCIQASCRPERQANGDIIWDGVLVDITERKQADEHRRSKEEAERTNQEKSRFLSRVSHELRTPLNAILGFSQVLTFSDLEEADALALSYIIKGGRHLLALVDEVLDLSCAETGHLHLALGEVEPDEVAGECVGLMTRLAEARGITCTVKMPGNPVTLHCDGQRLRQILLNLLSNAIKYNGEGGQVLVSFEPRPANRLRLNVTDSGSGISPAGIARLFVPFERLEHERGDVEGTGLGLVVSRRIAEAMDGSVGVESEVGQGSTFWIELPLATAQLRPAAGITNVTDLALPSAGTPPDVTLLYIEDNLSNLQVMQMLLARRRPHWRFISAREGRAGLEQARQQPPELILLDLQMPGMRGEDVLDELRRDPVTRRIPVIVLSADATPRSRARLLAQGADEYVSKPFQMEYLLDLFDRVLGRAEAMVNSE